MGEPVTTAATQIGTLLATGGGGLSTGWILKMMWDSIIAPKLKSNLSSSAEYLTQADCEKNQRQCVHIMELNKEFIKHKATTEAQLGQHDELLKDIKATVEGTEKHLAKMSTAIAIVASKLEKD